MEKLSYALGLLIGHNLKGMNIDGLVTAEFTRAVEQVLKGEKAEMTEVQAQGMVQEYMKEQQELAGHEVLTEAIGQKPVATDSVRCHYEGRLIDGTVFDSSYQRGEPTSFPLQGVIKGWTEGLQLMNLGAKFRFFIPYELAYGAQGAGGAIPPYAALVFDVELLGINE